MNIIMLYKLSFAALMGCIFLCACENNEAEIKNMSTRKLGVEEAKNVVLNYTLAGKTKAILTAPLMLRVQEIVPYVEFPNSLKTDFYNENGIQESKLTALYGKYKENQGIVYLRDSVKVINIKGDTLYCNELYWDRNRTGKEFYTDKPVRIRTKTHVIDGIGMESREDFREWNILKPTGNIQVPSSKFPG